MKARIKCVDVLNNVAYVHSANGDWRCTLANGISASFFYAGIGGDEMAVKFALEDAKTPEEALAVMQTYGGATDRYTLVS